MLRACTLICLCLLIVAVATAQDHPLPEPQPTAGQSAAQIDQAWKAGSAEYDSVRTSILAEVDQAANTRFQKSSREMENDVVFFSEPLSNAFSHGSVPNGVAQRC